MKRNLTLAPLGTVLSKVENARCRLSDGALEGQT